MEGFCKCLNVDEDEALALISRSVEVASEARTQFTLENKVLLRVKMCLKCCKSTYFLNLAHLSSAFDNPFELL